VEDLEEAQVPTVVCVVVVELKVTAEAEEHMVAAEVLVNVDVVVLV
jgi:hypothetical protein